MTMIIGLDPGVSGAVGVLTQSGQFVHCYGDVYKIPFKWKGKPANRYYKKVACSQCGKEHFQLRRNLKKKSRHFCSKECRKKGQSGAGNIAWSGGRKAKTCGHILAYAPDHPNARKSFVPEHRLVVEKAIGRYLKRDEFVHHINCKKDDNRIENLVVLSTFTHNKAHTSIERCVYELIERGLISFDRIANSYVVSP